MERSLVSGHNMSKVFLCLARSPAVHGQFVYVVSAELPGSDAGFLAECPVEGPQAFKTAASRDIADAAVCVSQPALCRGDSQGL